jgi:hypothetical protein
MAVEFTPRPPEGGMKKKKAPFRGLGGEKNVKYNLILHYD